MRATVLVRTAAFLFIVAATAGLGAGGAARPAASSVDVQGDVNCDSTVNSIDSLQVLRSVAGLSTNAGCLDAAGDVNCDGAINSVDSLRILRHVAGLASSTPDGCPPVGDPLGPPPSSFDLIDEALAAGDIDEETALVYKVYASFGDDSLPDEYQGDDTGGQDSGALMEAASGYGSVSPETQGLLAPFLVPPIYEESWMGGQSAAVRAGSGLVLPECPDAPPGWDCRDGTTADVRVWWQTRYPEDEARAQAIANAMDSTIWSALTGLMGQPLSDTGLAHDGGSGAVDIYLVDVVRSAAPAHSTPGCKKTPAYIDLARTASMSVVAHEFMHVLQWSLDVKTGCMYQQGGEYNWLAEATAEWAMDFVYPSANEEHDVADWFLGEPGTPLDTRDDRHEYGAYLFFYYLAEKYSSEVVKTIWGNVAAYDSLEAVDMSIAGGFEERWAEFALYNWNRPPVDDYKTWDQLEVGAKTVFRRGNGTLLVPLDGADSRRFEVESDPRHMAAFYHHFQFNDASVRSVVVDNTLAGYPHAAVQALVKVGGEWKQPQGWTGNASRTFCRDLDAQNIEELVIIISNSDWENKGALQPPAPLSFTARTAGCTDFTGTATADLYLSSVPTITYTVEVSGLRFQLYETAGNLAQYALVESPAVTWHASGTNGPCSVSGQMTLDQVDPFSDYQGEVKGNLTLNLDAHTYRADIFGYDPAAIVTMVCPDDYTDDEPFPVLAILDDGDVDHEATADGRLDGEFTTDQRLYSGAWEWHFDPAPPE